MRGPKCGPPLQTVRERERETRGGPVARPLRNDRRESNLSISLSSAIQAQALCNLNALGDLAISRRVSPLETLSVRGASKSSHPRCDEILYYLSGRGTKKKEERERKRPTHRPSHLRP
jgi:hypothetical protein